MVHSADSIDTEFMARALQLADRATGRTSPNPMVGAVIVCDGTVVGEGYHERAGTDHAEIVALRHAGRRAHGATMYVSLEPCSHHGKTPPCVDAIIRAGIARVVTAMVDPHELVAGQGIDRLEQAGIRVEVGVLESEARRLNEAHIKFAETGLPFVYMKYAMSIDGKMATRTRDARWVTGQSARHRVHELRNRVDAIIVGSGTVRADNPELTTRLPGNDGRDPVRIVLNTNATLDPQARVFTTDSEAPTWLFVGDNCPDDSVDRFRSEQTEVFRCRTCAGMIDLSAALHMIAERDIRSVLLEAGPILGGAAIESQLVDKILCFVAPIIVGGAEAPTPVGGEGIDRMVDAVRLQDVEIKMYGDDVLIEGYTPKEQKCLRV